MYIDYLPEAVEIEVVLNNLSELTKVELIKAFGEDYKNLIINLLPFTKYTYLIKLKADNSAVGMFGLVEETPDRAGIFFLSTDEMYKGNMIKLIRTSKTIVDEWLKEYKVLLDDCHQDNEKVMKWLCLLGFKPTGKIKEGCFFEYYKGDNLCLM